MAYQPLARTYRPSCFRELVGQDAVALALGNAIISGRTLTNLIFTGVRGVGKTTVARLYAKALNCEARAAQSAEPCNTCESCLAIAGGFHEDVLEIDGASNTGVADVRALQEEIEYAPKRSHFKVYIIDEVHMLSGAAFNALLKTLEERRPHVIFVFATTELQKVPETILSRCPTFHLKKLTIDTIVRQMQGILACEGIEAEDKALAVIAREGHGSMRDALTLLDQAIALGSGKVTLAALGPMVSTLSSSPFLDLLQALVRKDAAAALATIAALDEAGCEFPVVVEELAGFARHAFVVRDLGVKALDTALLGLDDGELQRLSMAAQQAQPFDLNRIFRTLVRCRGELNGEALDRFIVENYVFEWCLDPGLPDLEALLNDQGGGVRQAETAGVADMRNASHVQASANPGQRLAAARQALSGKSPVAPVLTVNAEGGGKASQPTSVGSSTVQATMARATGTPVSSGVNAVAHADHSLPSSAPRAGARAQSALDRIQAGEGFVDQYGSVGAAASSQVRFPPTWRELVEAWKRDKPLQARKLEEAHPLEYSPKRIALAVPEDSFASKGLLRPDEQARMREQFRELFGFNGTLVVTPRDQAATASPAPLPDTLLATRSKEADDRRLKLLDEARNAPFTIEVLAALGGTIEAITPLDASPTPQ